MSVREIKIHRLASTAVDRESVRRWLDELGAQAHKAQRVFEFHDASDAGRGVFAQAVAGDDRRQRTAGGDPGAVHGHAGGQHDRLGVGGERQRLFGAFLDQLGDVFAQRIRSFLERFEQDRMVAPGVEHADRLGTLARKNECEMVHVGFLNCLVLEITDAAAPRPR